MTPTPIEITILDSIGSVKRTASLPSHVPVRDLTVALVRKMGLPEVGANNRPMSYYLNLVRDNESHQLDEDLSLEEANIRSGDTIRINAEMQAGGRMVIVKLNQSFFNGPILRCL